MLNANPDRLGSSTEQLFAILVPCHRSVKLHVVRRTRSVVGGGVMPLAEPMQTFAERLRRDKVRCSAARGCVTAGRGILARMDTRERLCVGLKMESCTV